MCRSYEIKSSPCIAPFYQCPVNHLISSRVPKHRALFFISFLRTDGGIWCPVWTVHLSFFLFFCEGLQELVQVSKSHVNKQNHALPLILHPFWGPAELFLALPLPHAICNLRTGSHGLTYCEGHLDAGTQIQLFFIFCLYKEVRNSCKLKYLCSLLEKYKVVSQLQIPNQIKTYSMSKLTQYTY